MVSTLYSELLQIDFNNSNSIKKHEELIINVELLFTFKPMSKQNEIPKNTTNTALFSERYKWYVLLMLTLVGALNFFDRQLIVILQEPIKEARYADRNNRRNVVGISLAIWSFMTAITGMIGNFTQMLLVRIGVGIGEAGGTPSSQAMISDYFPKEKRATAFAIYATSTYIGLFLGFSMGGVLEATFGWRTAFMVLGVPGILFAIVFLLAVKEPPKGYADGVIKVKEQQDFKSAMKVLLSKKTYTYILMASALHSFVGYGFANWIPSFFIRVHGMEVIEVGFWLAVTVGIGGGIGAFSGGFIVDKLIKRDQRWYMWIGIVSIILTIPFSMYVLFTANTTGAAIGYFIPNVLFSLNMGALLTVTQGIVEVKMRALSSAVYYFVLNLVGLGLGPLMVGMLSDYLEPTYGNLSLRYTLFMVTIVYLFCMYFYWKAGEHLVADMQVRN